MTADMGAKCTAERNTHNVDRQVSSHRTHLDSEFVCIIRSVLLACMYLCCLLILEHAHFLLCDIILDGLQRVFGPVFDSHLVVACVLEVELQQAGKGLFVIDQQYASLCHVVSFAAV